MRFIKRKNDGTFEVKLRPEERDVIRSLIPQLRELIDERNPMAWRLFPNAYQDDKEKAAEYEDLVGDDLRRKRLAALKTIESTIDATRINEEQLLAWMGAVNDIRLVLGTRLDVLEETAIEDFKEDADRHLFAVYGLLGWLMEELVAAIY